MNWEQIEGNWTELKGRFAEKWGKLTDDDLTAIGGKRERLAGPPGAALRHRQRARREADRAV